VRIAIAASSPQRPGTGKGEAGRATKRLAVVDRTCTMPGRGAYLCRDAVHERSPLVNRACLEQALRRGAVARTLRTQVTLAPELVESVSR
jgi:predicted RNA-binding protein YlxR (DUF448 family)